MASPAQELTLIGVCDGEIDSRRYKTSFLTNKVGGQPDWSPLTTRQSPRCGCCGSPLVHAVQIYCPLDASPFHRNLHLFACPGADCGGGPECWKVFRSQCLETAVTTSRPTPAQEAPLSATDWCDSADDWGTGEEEDGWSGMKKVETEVSESDISSQLQDLSLGDSQEDIPMLRSFFISVVDESDLTGEEDDLQHAQQLLKDYEKREGVAVRALEGGDGEEKYEKASARHGDGIFSKFMKKISLCPQQILRYCHSGEPLFISKPPPNMAELVPACGICGGSRTFELQLMPALVSLLQMAGGGTELEFGTVLVYSCTKSCWMDESRSSVEEFCFVQSDPDQQLFK
ncbi:programmed cell death protein 2-like isoform X2 [Antennarius striatus]|uniref:programmed cell death protein 2-like isoform X2 n=1 Tax=Antennarius striatus TaxID=241820 RepID=UPI0035B0376A